MQPGRNATWITAIDGKQVNVMGAAHLSITHTDDQVHLPQGVCRLLGGERSKRGVG